MDTSVSPKDEIWFLRVCHHISKAVYLLVVLAAARKIRSLVTLLITRPEESYRL
jgi:hypothetical protein